MCLITIASFSTEAASKSKGEQLRGLLEERIKNKKEITVDFKGISRFASPFFNNSFAGLALVYGFDTIREIKIINISDIGKLAYDTSMDNAQLLAEKPEFSDKFRTIIDNTPKKVD